MSDPESAAWWNELDDHAARMVPRLDPRYGLCPVCRQSWTVPFCWGSIWYARCQPCGTYALLGERVFDAYVIYDRDDDDVEIADVSPEELQRIRDDFLYAGILELARAYRVEPLFTGVSMKTIATKTEPGAQAVLWSDVLATGAKGNNDPVDPAAPPSSWADLSPEARACVSEILTTPDPDGLGPWRLLRARFMTDQAENSVVTEKLKPFFVEDFEERAKWQRAATEIAQPRIGVEILELASRKLRAGGGLLAQLKAQRAALDATIARLENRLVAG